MFQIHLLSTFHHCIAYSLPALWGVGMEISVGKKPPKWQKEKMDDIKRIADVLEDLYKETQKQTKILKEIKAKQ